MRKIILLTVAQSKRLIAKGIANMPLVKEKLKYGTIVIAKGTTNAYIAEEILNKKIDKNNYVIGCITPVNKGTGNKINTKPLKEIVIYDGKVLENTTIIDSVKLMKKGDIFIKGGNALNYEKKEVGVLSSGHHGGTIRSVLPCIERNNVKLIIPIGLEKLIYSDVLQISEMLKKDVNWLNMPLKMIPIKGEIITEIEAIKILTNTKASSIASGGICGAEGSVMLLAEGSGEEINKLDNLLKKIYKK